MIIVSQDKQRAVNFDNITQIYITFCKENDPYYWIRFETVDSLYESLGCYETEERAEEVLKETITRYANWENMKMGQPTGICEPVYYIPED